MLVRSLAGCLNKFEKPKQDVSFKKGELVMLLRLSLFLGQFETLTLFKKSLIFFTIIDLQWELKWSLLWLRCLCGLILFKWLVIRMFFILHSVISILLRVLPFSFRSSPRTTMVEMATSVCFFFRLSAVAIIRLDIASGVSFSEISLVPTCSRYKDGPKSRFVGLIKSCLSTVFVNKKGPWWWHVNGPLWRHTIAWRLPI